MWGYELLVPSTSPVGTTCYESPCGVMRKLLKINSKTSITLRIPMWGYEMILVGTDHTVAASYESPCGVMSGYAWDWSPSSVGLRIPMWGYEVLAPSAEADAQEVTNPHVGL